MRAVPNGIPMERQVTLLSSLCLRLPPSSAPVVTESGMRMRGVHGKRQVCFHGSTRSRSVQKARCLGIRARWQSLVSLDRLGALPRSPRGTMAWQGESIRLLGDGSSGDGPQLC